jgi:hypothetical protein
VDGKAEFNRSFPNLFNVKEYDAKEFITKKLNYEEN